MAHSTVETHEYVRHLEHVDRVADSPTKKKPRLPRLFPATRSKLCHPSRCTCLQSLRTDQYTRQSFGSIGAYKFGSGQHCLTMEAPDTSFRNLCTSGLTSLDSGENVFFFFFMNTLAHSCEHILMKLAWERSSVGSLA